MSIREAIHAKTGSIFVEGGALTSFLARSAKIAPSSPNTRSGHCQRHRSKFRPKIIGIHEYLYLL